MDNYLHTFLLPYAVGYIFLVFVLPSYRLYKKTGKNPFLFGNTDSTHDYVGKQIRLVAVLTLLAIILFTGSPEYYRYLLPISYLETAIVKIAGATLLILSLVWTMAAQIQMGLSWRIGFSKNESTDLITTGLFSISRNPVFLGMMATQAGFFFLLPSAVALVILAQAYSLLQIQIRLEEEYLFIMHGEVYKEYLSSVRRWI